MLSEKQLVFVLNKLSETSRFKNIRSLSSIIEQILFSGSNLVISMAVVVTAGVAQFGIYSLIFSMTILQKGLNTSLIHRQMVLHSSSESESSQNQYFLHSIFLNFAFFLFICLFILIFSVFYISGIDAEQPYWTLVVPTLSYLYLYNLYDVCKQFLYVRDMQIYSLKCSTICITATLTLIVITCLFAQSEYIVSLTFISMALGFLIGLASNNYCRKLLLNTEWGGLGAVNELARQYWKQGRFGGLGATASWIQNQGLNPAIMFLGGPLIAGYLNLGRLFIMPIATVNQGLINSSTPTLRRIFKHSGVSKLIVEINKFSRASFTFAGVYILLIFIGHISGLLDALINDYSQLAIFIVFWSLFIFIVLYRFWCGQYFIVTLDLKYVLIINLIASGFVLTGGFVSFIVFDSYFPILISMIAGELFSSIMMLRERQKRILQQTI